MGGTYFRQRRLIGKTDASNVSDRQNAAAAALYRIVKEFPMTRDGVTEIGMIEQQPHKVLIVEDEQLIAMDVEDMVTSSQVDADVIGLASDKKRALDLAPMADIALVDVNLADGASGPEIGRILAETYGVTVIFMTGNPEMVENGIQGALGVLSKPVSPRTVEQTLRYAIARRRRERVVPPAMMRIFAA